MQANIKQSQSLRKNLGQQRLTLLLSILPNLRCLDVELTPNRDFFKPMFLDTILTANARNPSLSTLRNLRKIIYDNRDDGPRTRAWLDPIRDILPTPSVKTLVLIQMWAPEREFPQRMYPSRT